MRVSILVISAILVVVTAEQHGRVHLVGKTGANGVVDLIQMNGGVQMNGRVSGLTPGKHGFHVHQWGDIYSNGCDSTGPHLNPREMPHSGPENDNRHLGDLGNIEVDHKGHANIRLFAKDLYLTGPESIAGRALVIHGGEDDLGRGSNPQSKINGNSGSRVACGAVVLVP